MNQGSFTSDIQAIRERARRHIEEGAVTPSYGADKEGVIHLLNEALATEMGGPVGNRRHYYTARGLTSGSVAQEFMEHAVEEQEHADRIAERIVQLGGDPDFSPEGLATRSHAEYVEGDSLPEMIKEDLIAERIAIESYRDIVQFLGDRDPTTRRLMEEVLAKEEEHAEDLVSLIQELQLKV